MPAPSFQFEQVDLNAIRGFSGQSFQVQGLRPGIVVIHGPNTAGKSTLALAMELLLWDQLEAPEGTFLGARVRVGGHPQERTRIQDRLVAKVDGQAVAASAWISPETRERYRLSLTDLLQKSQTNQPFGRHLSREMAGGVDFPALRRDAPAAFSRRIGETAAYNQAQKRVDEQAQEQKAQESLEAEIRGLEAEVATLDRHQRAEKHLTALDRAMDSLERLLDQDAALAPFAGREGLLLALQDHDDSRFQEYREAREAARAALNAEEARLGQLEAQLAPLDLPAEILEDHPLETRRLAAQLEEAERAAAETGTDRAEADALLDDWQRACPWPAGPEGLPELSREVLEGARSLARKFEQSQGLLHALGRLAEDLGPEEAVPALPPPAAAGLLDQWLDQQRSLEALPRAAQPGPRPGTGAWLLLGAGLLAGLAAVALALRAGALPAAAAAAAALLALVLGALGLRPRPVQGPDRAGLQRDLETLQARYTALAAPAFAPGAWTPADVANLAGAIRSGLARAEALALRNEDRIRARRRKEDEALRWEGLRAEAARLALQLNLPGEAGEAFGGYLELFATRLQAGQALRARVASARGLHGEAAGRHEKLRVRAAEHLERFHRTPRTDLAAGLTELAGHLETALKLRAERDQILLDRARRRLDPRPEPLDTFLAGLGLQEHTFQEAWETRQRWRPLMAGFAAQLNLVETLFRQENRWNPEFQALAERGARPLAERREDLARIRAEVQAELQGAQATLLRITESQKDLARRQETLKHLTRGGTLASLILERDLAAQQLETRRVQELEGRTLGLLIDRLERRGAEEDLKPQLKRASELFQQFTQYRYELRFIKDTFMAKEGSQVLDLAQLSEGTRLQLLMAVRLAYVEYQEGPEGIQLPLFLDEVLANCDDRRAAAIIEAIKVMAATGRQIFYFTAQQDEVEKWRTLGGGGIQIIDLAEVRRLGLQQRIPLPGRDWTRPPVPDPGAASLLDYARTLGAHSPALWVPLGRQHAWLAFGEGEQQALHEALQGGLATLGQLKGYLETQPDAAAAARVTTIAILEEAQAQLQAARPRPLSAADLERAEIKGFGDRTHLLECFSRCQGDPRRLLATPIPDVGPKKVGYLREWLQAGGYLQDQETPAEEILAGLKGRYSSSLGLAAPGWLAVERFVLAAGQPEPSLAS